jgi:orotate phosphoribosyltransferase
MLNLDDVRLILQKGVEIGDGGEIDVDLASATLAHPGPIADGFASFLRANGKIQHVGAIGGSPLMGPVIAALLTERIFKPAFAVRDDRIEGELDGRPVILVDDVLDTGTTLGNAIVEVNKQEIEVASIFVFCNRGGITQIDGIPVWHMFTLHEIANGMPGYREVS